MTPDEIKRLIAEAGHVMSKREVLMLECLNQAMATLGVYADPTGYTDNDGDRLTPDTELHPGILAQQTIDSILAIYPFDATAAPDLAAQVVRLTEALTQLLIEYDEVDLDGPEPASLTEAVKEARATLEALK